MNAVVRPGTPVKLGRGTGTQAQASANTLLYLGAAESEVDAASRGWRPAYTRRAGVQIPLEIELILETTDQMLFKPY